MSTLNLMSAFLKLGELDTTGTREDKLAYDTKIVFASMRNMIPEWEAPANWNELSIEDRENRIAKLKEILLGTVSINVVKSAPCDVLIVK